MSQTRQLPRSNYADKLREFSDFVFTEDAALSHAATWRKFFRSRIGVKFDGRMILELGCSDGALLTTLAAQHPETAFMGLDWKCKPLHDCACRIAALKLRNVALLRARAQDIGHIFAPREVDEIWLFHPEPCDSEAEMKNRLITERFLIDARQVLRNDGLLTLKTDHLRYYQWTLALLGVPAPGSAALRRMFEITVNSCNFWNDPHARSRTASRLFAGQMTPFENRFVRKRLPIYYVELRATPI